MLEILEHKNERIHMKWFTTHDEITVEHLDTLLHPLSLLQRGRYFPAYSRSKRNRYYLVWIIIPSASAHASADVSAGMSEERF